MRVSPFLVWGLLPIAALAQRGASGKPAPTGIVTGHVFFADTNGPARLANVVLEPAEAIDGYKPDAGHADGISAHLSGVQTLPDGSFLIPRVAPGTYYVYAWAPGYVSAISTLGATNDQLLKPDAAIKEAIARTLPRATVQANLPASVDVTLQRGAAVSGTVLYDDGSPAAGLEVRLLVRQKDKWVEPRLNPLEFTPNPMTDDKGSFRIAGLPDREYLAAVELSFTRTGYDINGGGFGVFHDGGGSKLMIYSGDQFRTKNAHPFKVKLGEERPGEDITIPLAKLHTVAGAVTAARDGHTLNGGTVTLLYADDRTEAATTKLAHGDTSWSLPFVPEGDYLVRVTDGVDAEYDELPNPPGTPRRPIRKPASSIGTGRASSRFMWRARCPVWPWLCRSRAARRRGWRLPRLSRKS